MKIAFIHDNRFSYFDGEYYSSGQFSYALWQRYLKYYDELLVVGRSTALHKNTLPKGLTKSSGEKVEFCLLDSISDPFSLFKNRHNVYREMESVLTGVDGLIIRLPSEFGLIAAALANKHGINYIIEVVGCAYNSLWYHGNFFGKLYAPLMAYRTRKVINNAPKVLYVTKQYLQSRYPCKQGEILACSDADITDYKEAVNIITNNEKIVFGLIGSFSSKYKGIDTVLYAINKYKKKLNGIEVRFVGDGDYSYWLKLAEKLNIQDIVKFYGALGSRKEVISWLDNIDVYIQPSLTEGLPRALIEAMSRGLPAIATSVGGIPELLQQDNIIFPKDYKSLGKLMIKAKTDCSWRLDAAKYNLNKSYSYSLKNLKKKREKFYTNI